MGSLRAIGAAVSWGLVLAAIAAGTTPAATAAGARVTRGGTRIVNSASATYNDPHGKGYTTQSNPIEVTVAKVAALVVTPKQAQVDPKTDWYIFGRTVTRTYSILNASDIRDAYTITAVKAGRARVQSITFLAKSGPIPVTIGSTVSPTIRPGDSIGVQVVLTTTGIPVGSTFAIRLQAQTTAKASNGLQRDAGRTWAFTKAAPKLTGPSGGQISKTVDHVPSVHSNSGGFVRFDVVVKNSGGADATNVVMKDDVPPGLSPVLSSVQLNGVAAGSAASLSGNTLTVRVPKLGAGLTLDVSFNASVLSSSALGATFVNVASISADGLPPQSTTPASVLIGTSNIVFDGFGGPSQPIPGAIVSLLDSSGQPVKLASSVTAGAATSATSNGAQNPVITGADGSYAFNLTMRQIGIGSRFYLTVAAPNYLKRKIRLDITPGTDGRLYNVTATALDAQPLAAAGGFQLVTKNVLLQNVLGLFGNIPLFSSQALSVNKTASTQIAQPGDRILFTISVVNTYRVMLYHLKIVDLLPPGMLYAPGTALINNVRVEPIVAGNTLTWTLAQVAPASQNTIQYATVIFPSVTPGTTLTNQVTVTGTTGKTGVTAHGASSTSVQIVAGPLSQRGIITGRVFLDAMKTGHFAKGDTGIAGVRVYLEDGTAVLTDNAGRYSFAGVRPGMHVLRVDPTTLPTGVHPYPNEPMNSSRALMQLVHGILDDGTLEDINFALAGGA